MQYIPYNTPNMQSGWSAEYVGIFSLEALVSFRAAHYTHIQKVADVSFNFIKHKCSWDSEITDKFPRDTQVCSKMLSTKPCADAVLLHISIPVSQATLFLILIWCYKYHPLLHLLCFFLPKQKFLLFYQTLGKSLVKQIPSKRSETTLLASTVHMKQEELEGCSDHVLGRLQASEHPNLDNCLVPREAANFETIWTTELIFKMLGFWLLNWHHISHSWADTLF